MPSQITFWNQMRGLLSAIPASAGVMATARLGSGTANSSSYLRGDQTWTNLTTLKTDLGLTTQITINGTSDVTQLDITPFSGQTSRQQIWRNSAGTLVCEVDANGRVVLGSGSWTLNSSFDGAMWGGGAYGWASTAVTGTTAIDTGLYRDGAAGFIAARFGTQAHVLRIYNTYTTSSNYERGNIGFLSNVYTIGSYAAGTGTLRGINFGVSGNSIGFYGVTPIARPTTAGAAAAFVANAGTAVNDASTFGGYTLKQVVQALQSLGLLT